MIKENQEDNKGLCWKKKKINRNAAKKEEDDLLDSQIGIQSLKIKGKREDDQLDERNERRRDVQEKEGDDQLVHKK